MFKLATLLLCCWVSLSAGRLTVSGRDFYYNGQKVFLSGVNIAWNSYGYDFGNGQYAANSKSTLESWLTRIDANGGNSVRKESQNVFYLMFFKCVFFNISRNVVAC